MSSVEKLTVSIDLKFVTNWSVKFVMNLFSWNRKGIQGTFWLFRKVFKMDQYVSKLVEGLANLFDNLE